MVSTLVLSRGEEGHDTIKHVQTYLSMAILCDIVLLALPFFVDTKAGSIEVRALTSTLFGMYLHQYWGNSVVALAWSAGWWFYFKKSAQVRAIWPIDQNSHGTSLPSQAKPDAPDEGANRTSAEETRGGARQWFSSLVVIAIIGRAHFRVLRRGIPWLVDNGKSQANVGCGAASGFCCARVAIAAALCLIGVCELCSEIDHRHTPDPAST